LDRDLSFDLDKRDGGTKSVVVKQLNLKEMVQDKPVEQVLTLNGLLPK